MRRWLRTATALLTAAAAVVVAESAHAGPFDTLGYDPETAAVANSSLSYGKSLGVLFTNPALLPFVDDQVKAGMTFIAPRLHVHLMGKPQGTDVPISIYDSNIGATPGLQNRALPTVELLNARGDTNKNGLGSQLGLGFASSFGVDKLKIAALVQVPVSGGNAANIATHYDDEREATFSNRISFARFGQWDPVVSAVVGVGYQVLPTLGVGFSAEIAAGATANLDVYIPDAAVQSYANSNLNAVVSIRARPIAGVRWEAMKGLAFGLVWRNESYFQVDATDQVTLWNQHEADPNKTILKRTTETFPIVFDYVPMELAASVGVSRGAFTAQLAATWQRWSAYLDGHHETPQDAAAFPASPFNGASFDTSPYKFHDIVALHGGVSWRYLRGWETTVGGAWYPSPVPAQTGRTNFADGDLVGVTVGQKHELRIGKRRLVVAVALQVFRMLDRTTYKDPSKIVDEFPDGARTLEGNRPMPEARGLQTNNPGFPGYQSGGFLSAASLSIAHLF